MKIRRLSFSPSLELDARLSEDLGEGLLVVFLPPLPPLLPSAALIHEKLPFSPPSAPSKHDSDFFFFE